MQTKFFKLLALSILSVYIAFSSASLHSVPLRTDALAPLIGKADKKLPLGLNMHTVPVEDFSLQLNGTPALVILPESGLGEINAKESGPAIPILATFDCFASEGFMTFAREQSGLCYPIIADGKNGYGGVAVVSQSQCLQGKRTRVSLSGEPFLTNGGITVNDPAISDNGEGVKIGETAALLFNQQTEGVDIARLADVAFEGARVFKGNEKQQAGEVYISVGALARITDGKGNYVLAGKFLEGKKIKSYEFKPAGGGVQENGDYPDLVDRIDRMAKQILGPLSYARERTPGKDDEKRELRLFVKLGPDQQAEFRVFVAALFAMLNGMPDLFDENARRELREELTEETWIPSFLILHIIPSAAIDSFRFFLRAA